MEKIVFICRGNMIRSQICKALFNKLKNDAYSFAESYGTDVLIDGNEGVELEKQPHLSNLIKIMRDHRMDISKEKSKQLREDLVKDSVNIIYMGRRKNIPDWMEKYNYEYWEDCLNEIEKNKDLNLNVKVPKFGETKDIEDTITLLENKVLNLLKTL
jgi:protein-tyrosine-phosphatase